MGKEIDEAIADAMAEEEVEREQEEIRAREDVKDVIRECFINELKPSRCKVKIDIDEYIMLKFKERDLGRILTAIVDGFTLSYSKDDLYFSENKNVLRDVFKALYPETYEEILNDLLREESEKD